MGKRDDQGTIRRKPSLTKNLYQFGGTRRPWTGMKHSTNENKQ